MQRAFEDVTLHELAESDNERIAHALRMQIEAEELALTVTRTPNECRVLQEDIEAHKFLYRHFSGRMYE